MFKFSFAIAIIVKFNCIRYVAAANINERGTKIAINNGSNERNKILRGVKNETYSLESSFFTKMVCNKRITITITRAMTGLNHFSGHSGHLD